MREDIAVSYECEQCNPRTVPPSAWQSWQCISQTSAQRAFARLPSLVPKPRAHGGTANLLRIGVRERAGVETKRLRRTCLLTKRHGVTPVRGNSDPNNGQQKQSPLSSLHRQQQRVTSAADARTSSWELPIIIIIAIAITNTTHHHH